MADGATHDTTSDVYAQNYQEGQSELSQPETPTGKQQPRLPPMRLSAEKYNRNNRLVRQRSPPVPEADLDTSKLAVAFPGFSGVGDDIKPLSPNPFMEKGRDHSFTAQAKSRAAEVKEVPYCKNSLPPLRETHPSIVNENRPSLVNFNNKNTRFGRIHNPKIRQGPQPHMFMPAPGLVQNTTTANVSKPLAINAHGSLTSMPNGSTHQSLNLPQGPNLTDVFSGVVRQPPPANVQPVRPRASRFTSASKLQEVAEPKAEGIPVPANERHLLRSIDILQNRVAELEKIQAQLETTNGSLEQKTFDPEVEKRELEGRQRRDSAVGSADGANEHGDLEQLTSRNKRLVSQYWALTGQKDILVRDLQIAQTTIKDIEQQRDHFKGRFATAESDIARIHSEKATIGQQREQAITQLAIANSNVEALTQDKDALLDENERLKARIAQLMRTSTAKNDVTPEHSGLEYADADDEGPLDIDSISMANQQQKIQQIERRSEQQQTDPSTAISPASSHNITYISYAGGSGSCIVRKDLEHERKARHQSRQAEISKEPTVNVIDKPQVSANATSDQHARQSSDSSVSTTRITRRTSPLDISSSFILPDITLELPPATESQAAALPAAVPQLPLELAPLATVESQAQRSEPAQQPSEPAKRLTISDEELDLTITDEEPTERPSQPPAAALAAVIESVQAERVSQQMQLAKYQANYNRHDTSISRRQRKQLHAKIIDLTESIDRKADQIYNLHDVIADQERRGQSMTQDQVDNTLQSLGLNLPWEGIASSTTTSRRRGTTSTRSL
ncbi:MAG: hypothetical protein Q9166_004716 [cf. Caloplaca sp. 2 TL-2023]